MEKRGESEPIAQTAPMYWGTKLQAPILDAFAVQHPEPMARDVFLRSAEYPFMLGNLDAQLSNAVVEAKTARNAEGWGEDGSAEAPVDYVVQAHHYMIVAKLRLAYLPVLIAGSDFRIIRLPFDDELGAMIVEANRKLWAQIQAATPPEPKTLADVNAFYRHSRSAPVEATDTVAAAVRQLQSLRALESQIRGDIDKEEATIKTFLAERDTLTYRGKTLATWREQTTTRLDSKALKAQAPDVWEAFSTESSSRRFLLKGE
jgi:predicted phage-related endonuclease